MINASKIREILVRYLSDNDAERLQLDFSAAAYNIHKEGEREAIDLVRDVEAKIADFQGGCISRARFQACIRQLAIAPIDNSYIVLMPTSSSANRLFYHASLGFEWAADWAAPESIRFEDKQPASV
jgi:hypothetical protein